MAKWLYQNTPYLSALPGVGGPGLDVSNGDLPSKMYFVTSRENVKEGGPAPEFGPNCYAGTLWWCWYANHGEDFSKWMFPLESGYCYAGRGLNSPLTANFDYVGHAAPGAGFFPRCARMGVSGSNSRIWHMPSWLGDEPGVEDDDAFPADQRDCLNASHPDQDINRVAFINCEARFGMDEQVQVWYNAQGCSWIRGAIYDPLHTPPDFVVPGDDHHGPDNDHGFGQIISGRADYSLCMQSLYAHNTDRNPLVSAPNHAQINCLHYNHGRPDIGSGAGIKIDDNGEHNAEAGNTMQANIVGNITVRGPEQGDAIVLVEVQDVTEGSSGHGALNSQFGWEPPTSQQDFFKFNFTESTAESYLEPTLRPAAWPRGLGFNYDGTVKPCADPLHPTKQEGLAFVQLMRETVGCMPSRRYLYSSGVDVVLDQIDTAIRGLEQPPQYVNTVEEAGGWPDIEELSLDPTQPNAQWWHAPLPLGADRDDILLEGTFSDGSSKVGYSKLRAWVIEQYFFVMGR